MSSFPVFLQSLLEFEINDGILYSSLKTTNSVPKNLKSRSHSASIIFGIIGARIEVSRIGPSVPSVCWSGLNTL